jgi:hypothetical protein
MHDSEAVVVCGDKALHLIKISEVFEDSVLKNSVKLMLYTSKDSSLFEGVDAKAFEAGLPVHLMEVENSELVQNIAHTGLDFSLIKILVYC